MDGSSIDETANSQLPDHTPEVNAGENLRQILDVAPGALLIADCKGRITQANRTAKDILGVPPESLIGRDINDVPVRLVTSEGADLRIEDIPMVRALSRKQDVLNEDLGVITPLGELKFLLVSAVPLSDEHGCSAGVVSSFIDITDRKRAQKALEESEKRLRLILDNMRDIVFLLDAQSNVVYISPSVQTHLGITPEEIMSGPSFMESTGEYLHPEDRPKLIDLWMETISGHGSDNQEFRAISKDGRVIWFSASWSPITDREGRVIAVQGSMRDITDRVLAREARARAEEEKRNFYRTTIAAFTGGRLQIVDHEETDMITVNPEVIVKIDNPEDAAHARNTAKKVMEQHGVTGDCADSFLLAVGEAIANAIRHGQGGELRAGYNGEDVWVAVVDHGPGIETLALPRVTLELGYSGKVSLGMGYSMIMDMADRVWLSTSQDGTTVVMTCCAEVVTPREIVKSLPDTW